MAHLSDDEVLANLGGVIGSRRKITAQLVAYLGEVEARRLDVREACSSMYEFCCRKLKLSEGSAHRHIAAARIARKYPMVLDLLREGRIHVTALSMLQRYLDKENHAELLAAACDKSKAEVELLIRSRFPKEDVADSIRLLPVQACLGGDAAAAGQSVGVAAQTVAADSGPATLAAGDASAWTDLGSAIAERAGLGRPFAAAASLSARADAGFLATESRPRVSPLSAERFHVQFSAGAALKDKLERALDLMSHSNPKRDLATVIERGLDLVLADLEKKKLGKTDRPRRSRGTKHGDFSREARREIYERDGEQCTYVSPSGERCRARAFLQLDHEDPRACGGAGTTLNGRLLCRAHNLFEAEKVFGRKYVESRIRLRQQRQQRLDGRSRRTSDESCSGDPGVPEPAERDSIEGAIRLRQQGLECESPRATEESRVVQVGAAVGPESPRKGSAGDPDSVDGATRLRQQRLNCESRRGNGQPSVTGDAWSCRPDADPPTLVNAPSCLQGNADPRTLVDALSCRPDADPPTLVNAPSRLQGNADPPTLVDAPSCAGDTDETVTADAPSRAPDHAAELRADESLLCPQHVAGGTANLASEVLPRSEVRGEARVDSAEMQSRLVSALTNMGFRRGESKKAVAALELRGDTHCQRAEDLAALVRQALAILVP